MKVIRLLLLLCLGWTGLQAQFIEPVKWSFEAVPEGEAVYRLDFHASIDPGWHLYSHYIEEGGPIPTGFFFDENGDFALEGELEESGEREAKYDEIFQMDLAWFKKEATFSQRVVLSPGVDLVQASGYLEFMVCNDRECLPPEEVTFRFALGQSTPAGSDEEGSDTEAGGTVIIQDPGVSIGGGASETEPGEFEMPVEWEYRIYPSEVSEDILAVEWRATLLEGWHIYSAFIDEGGPIPTSLHLEENENIELVGDLEESGDKITKQDEIFDMLLSWYDSEVTLMQKMALSDPDDPTIEGWLDFMVCDEEQCLFQDVSFGIDLSEINRDGEWVPFGLPETASENVDCGDGVPLIMCKEEFDHDMATSDCSGHESHEEKKSYWLIFILGFGGGLLALLTPCVFPMIPLTVSFFTKGSEKANASGIRNAIIYGLSIIVIYVSLGLIITLSFGPEMLNWIATDPIFNVFFFLVFVFFALSFFGYFDLTLPSSWTNKTDSIANKGGLVGIFFMAFTLALVSFSCTGPIIGSLIVGAVQEGVMGPFFGMLGFAVALALPFTLFAIFPKLMNAMPQSGGWLETVKKFLGFLELAFALKFLSTADLTKHWGILKYELFIGLWILIFMLLGMYLLGIFTFKNEKRARPGWLRGGVGLASLVFTGYMVFGVVNQKPLLSGIAPAPGYSLFNPTECPIGVNVCFHDYEEGMAYARANNKPVMLDFTGYGCVNCRLMENNVWTDEKVNLLLNEYVIISLYVDDRSDLPEEKQYTSTATGRTKEIRKVGKYWHDFQFRHFGTLSQPYYVLVGPNGEVLNKPVAFTGKEEYIKFLECGLTNLKGVCPECHEQVARTQ